MQRLFQAGAGFLLFTEVIVQRLGQITPGEGIVRVQAGAFLPRGAGGGVVHAVIVQAAQEILRLPCMGEVRQHGDVLQTVGEAKLHLRRFERAAGHIGFVTGHQLIRTCAGL